MNKIEKFWKDFLKFSNISENLKYADCYYFDFEKESADNLAELVRIGKKRATTSLYIENEFDTIVGEYNIITDFSGNPIAVIQITEVIITAFKNITFDLAMLEGEDEIFDTWLNNHIKFLSEDAKNYNIIFNENTLVVFEKFKTVYSK